MSDYGNENHHPEENTSFNLEGELNNAGATFKSSFVWILSGMFGAEHGGMWKYVQTSEGCETETELQGLTFFQCNDGEFRSLAERFLTPVSGWTDVPVDRTETRGRCANGHIQTGSPSLLNTRIVNPAAQPSVTALLDVYILEFLSAIPG